MGRGDAVAVAGGSGRGGTSRPFTVTSSLSAASIKIRFAWRGSFDQIERAAQNCMSCVFGIRLSRVDWLLSLLSVSLHAVFSTHLHTTVPPPPTHTHTAFPSLQCLFLSLNRMSSLNPLMTISFDDIPLSPLSLSLLPLFIFYYICINSSLFGKAISISISICCIFDLLRLVSGFRLSRSSPTASLVRGSLYVAVFDFEFE